MNPADKALLRALAENGRAPISTLARMLGAARTTVKSRIERLESSGIIAGYTVRLGPAAQTARIRATVLLQIRPHAAAGVLARLRKMDAVTRAHSSSGRFDLIVELATDTTAALDDALDRIGSAEGVMSSESLIHLSTRIDRAI